MSCMMARCNGNRTHASTQPAACLHAMHTGHRTAHSAFNTACAAAAAAAAVCVACWGAGAAEPDVQAGSDHEAEGVISLSRFTRLEPCPWASPCGRPAGHGRLPLCLIVCYKSYRQCMLPLSMAFPCSLGVLLSSRYVGWLRISMLRVLSVDEYNITQIVTGAPMCVLCC
jgi:hypothetical protein